MQEIILHIGNKFSHLGMKTKIKASRIFRFFHVLKFILNLKCHFLLFWKGRELLTLRLFKRRVITNDINMPFYKGANHYVLS